MVTATAYNGTEEAAAPGTKGAAVFVGFYNDGYTAGLPAVAGDGSGESYIIAVDPRVFRWEAVCTWMDMVLPLLPTQAVLLRGTVLTFVPYHKEAVNWPQADENLPFA